MKTYRQCNALMGKVRDQLYKAYDKGYEQGKTDFKRADGKWDVENLGAKGMWYRCSNCKRYAIAGYMFCPQCGSKMIDSEEEEDELE